jgi:hypothetical protein
LGLHVGTWEMCSSGLALYVVLSAVSLSRHLKPLGGQSDKFNTYI